MIGHLQQGLQHILSCFLSGKNPQCTRERKNITQQETRILVISKELVYMILLVIVVVFPQMTQKVTSALTENMNMNEHTPRWAHSSLTTDTGGNKEYLIRLKTNSFHNRNVD